MKTKILISLILVLAFFLRFYQLGSLPNSFTPDEVAQGYTAYSFLATGQDEWGSQNIFNLRSFGDFKPPLQTLLIMPSVKLFGLNPFAIRFPNAFLSTLAILTTYLFAQALTGSTVVALITALLLTLSPWHLPMSRLALEANITVFLISVASWLYLVSAKKPWLQTISALLFILNLTSYHSAKYFTPLYVLALFFYTNFHPKISFSSLKSALKSHVFFWLPFFFFTFLLLVSASASRVSDIAIFNPTDKWQSVSSSRYISVNNGLPDAISRVFNNKLNYTITKFVGNYLSVFSPQFLLTQGAGETTYGMIPGFGVLGLFGFVGFAASVFFLTKSAKFRKMSLFLVIVLLLAALPASMAKSNYSANRLSTLMPFIQIIASLGLYQLFKLIDHLIPAQSLFRSSLIFVLVVVFLFDSANFLQTYFFQSQTILADGMLYGHQQANDYISTHPHLQVVYSRKTSEPQAYVMFFQKINPRVTQEYTPYWLRYVTEGKSFVDQMGEYYLSNFIFREVNFPSDKLLPNTILVGRPEEIPLNFADQIIYSPDPNQQKPLMVIYDTSLHKL